MRRRVLLVALVTGLSGLAAWSQVAGAQAVERVQISDQTRQQHGLPANLSVELSSPAGYERSSVSGNAGTWAGPHYEEPGNPANGGTSSMEWSVTFDERQGDPDAVAFANLTHRDWPRDQRGGFSIEHVVGQKVLGTILGYFYLVTPGNGDARFEGVLAFPLDTNLHAVVRVEAVEPATDLFTVSGSLASTWNRAQAILALSGVELRGNLAPKIVGARTYKRGRVVRGKVVDRFLNAVLGARVSLERNASGSWRRIAGGKTNPRGFYALGATKRGTYRVTVKMAGFSAMSRAFRAGRG
jgi:hypothetical protein